MSDAAIWVAIVLGGVGTYAIRAVFLASAERLAVVPSQVRVALRMIPAAALAALAIPRLFRPHGGWDPVSPEMAAGLLALIVAWRTRSIPATIGVGLLAVVAFERLVF